jgi:hypothetical protein
MPRVVADSGTRCGHAAFLAPVRVPTATAAIIGDPTAGGGRGRACGILGGRLGPPVRTGRRRERVRHRQYREGAGWYAQAVTRIASCGAATAVYPTGIAVVTSWFIGAPP